MKTPNSTDLLKTLINLLADQEGATITYDIIDRNGEVQTFQTMNAPTM